MYNEISDLMGSRARAALTIALIAIALWALVEAVSGLKELRFIGAGVPSSNTISVSGEGEIFAVPDIATFSVTVTEEAKDVETAQANAAEKTNEIISYLKGEGIEDRDIRTNSYNAYPRYEFSNALCRDGFCPPMGERILAGFEVSQTLSVKVRDTDKAGEILSGVGERGATSVSGLSFTIDDEDALVAEARAKAIEEARTKAKELADDLGVRLVRIVGFNEGAGAPFRSFSNDAAVFQKAESAPSPQLPTGENRITSFVTITYEIR